MILRDRLAERAAAERTISALTHQEQWIDVDTELQKFEQTLAQPLNFHRLRDAVLQEVGRA